MIIIFENWLKSNFNFWIILVHCGPTVLNKGNLLRANVNCSGAKLKKQQDSEFFLLFQLLRTMLTINGFHSKNNL